MIPKQNGTEIRLLTPSFVIGGLYEISVGPSQTAGPI